MIVPRDEWMGGKILPKHRCWFASQNTVAGWIARGTPAWTPCACAPAETFPVNYA